MTIKFYDTNALLLLLEKVFEENFIISSVTLQEIEHIKSSRNKDDEVKFKARRISHLLDNNSDKYKVVIAKKEHEELLDHMGLSITPDNLITACAKSLEIEDLLFVSNDINCKVIAKNIFNLNVCDIKDLEIDEYKGYKDIVLSDEDLAYLYSNLDKNTHGCLINEYLITRDKDGEITGRFKWDGSKYSYLKINRIKNFKPLNIQQELAFDLMSSDTPIKILLGNAGSGKTLINLKYAINSVHTGNVRRILYLRDMIGKGSPIGFLKGSKMEKMMPFLAGVVDNLERGEDELQDMIKNGELEVDTPYFLKGASKEETWFLVDEAEDLDIEMLKLIGTRLNKGSCICLSGDLHQTESRYKGNNGLRTFIDKFKGDPLVGILKLKEDVRSDASKLFNTL